MGPNCVCCIPADLDSNIKNTVSTRSMNLVSGSDYSIPKHLELITFPSVELKGLIKYFQVKKPNKPNDFTNAAVILLFGEENDAIFYKYHDNFNDLFTETSEILNKLVERKANSNELRRPIEGLQRNVMSLLEELYMAEMPTGDAKSFPSETSSEPKRAAYTFKIIVCGDPQVGKTSVILRETDNVFRKAYIMSIGVNITSKIIQQDDAQIDLVIWDIAGQSKFDKSRRLFYEGARGMFIVFDLTRPETFHSIERWCNDIKQSLKSDIPGYILGNKADLIDDTTAVIDSTDIQNIACDMNFEYIQTSAFTGENVDDAFTRLATLIRNGSQRL
ncbi:MAG TPA: Rab family GTPase [Candidatus Lokiarchaeia archaeon]|nr:Rab family GTPase [Candidatus Lokiarchaeia archaeon]